MRFMIVVKADADTQSRRHAAGCAARPRAIHPA